VRLNATSRQLGILLGPAIGGGLMLALGPGAGLAANVLFYVPLVWWMWKAPYGGEQRRKDSTARRGGIADAWAAMREVSGNRTIVSMILLAGTSSLLVGNAFQAQMPEFAHDLGTEKADFSYAVLLTANAAGALAAGITLESRTLLQVRPQTAIVLSILWCASIAAFAVSTSYALAVALMFAAGFLNLSFVAMAQALIQLEAPAHLRGRLIGVYYLSNNGLRAFSGVSVGVLGALIGIHWSLALSALALLAVTFTLLAFSLRARGG
jgi:MFS family permease